MSACTPEHWANDMENLRGMMTDLRKSVADALLVSEGSIEGTPEELKRQSRRNLLHALDLVACTEHNLDSLNTTWKPETAPETPAEESPIAISERVAGEIATHAKHGHTAIVEAQRHLAKAVQAMLPLGSSDTDAALKAIVEAIGELSDAQLDADECHTLGVSIT